MENKDYFTRLDEHMVDREWSEEQREEMIRKVAHHFASAEFALDLLETARENDEEIEAQKQFDAYFLSRDHPREDRLPLYGGWDVT